MVTVEWWTHLWLNERFAACIIFLYWCFYFVSLSSWLDRCREESGAQTNSKLLFFFWPGLINGLRLHISWAGQSDSCPHQMVFHVRGRTLAVWWFGDFYISFLEMKLTSMQAFFSLTHERARTIEISERWLKTCVFVIAPYHWMFRKVMPPIHIIGCEAKSQLTKSSPWRWFSTIQTSIMHLSRGQASEYDY